jgi:hypothetical protein
MRIALASIRSFSAGSSSMVPREPVMYAPSGVKTDETVSPVGRVTSRRTLAG